MRDLESRVELLDSRTQKNEKDIGSLVTVLSGIEKLTVKHDAQLGILLKIVSVVTGGFIAAFAIEIFRAIAGK